MKKTVEKNAVESVEIINAEDNQVYLMDDARKLVKTMMRTVRTMISKGADETAKRTLDSKIVELTEYIEKFESKEKLFALCKVLSPEERKQLLEMLNNKED